MNIITSYISIKYFDNNNKQIFSSKNRNYNTISDYLAFKYFITLNTNVYYFYKNKRYNSSDFKYDDIKYKILLNNKKIIPNELKIINKNEYIKKILKSL